MRMPKRKRHDLYIKQNNNRVNDSVCDDNNEELSEEKFSAPEIEDLRKKKATLEFKDNVSTENVLSLTEDAKALDEKTVSENISITKLPSPNDNLNLRRKSNRIQSLKKSNQLTQNNSVVTSSFEESTSTTQTNENFTVETNSFVNNSTESIKGSSASASDVSSSSGTTPSSTQNKSIGGSSGKSLRKIQVWTEDDTRWFFEALCEHGKDFPHIQSYIASRCEKKGIAPDLIKNYEQVRHYYYRMWHKISQMLNISNVVEKGTQEIYGLINYGEIWRRFGTKFDSKLSLYLQQLVDYGYTVFKVKGKSVRVRTPICNALKRIHNIDYKTINKPITQPIPKEIPVELIPATNSDWIRVHSLAQNPRLRTKLTMQHRLSTLVSYLERRWSTSRVNENISRALLGIDVSKGTNGENEDKTFYFEEKCKLRLKPQNSEKLSEKVTLKSTSNSISCNNYRSTTHGNTQIDLSLSAYLKNLFNESSNLNTNKKTKVRKSNKKFVDRDVSASDNSKKNENDKSKNEQEELFSSCENISTKNTEQPVDLLKLLDSMNEELENKTNQTNKLPVANFKNTNETSGADVEVLEYKEELLQNEIHENNQKSDNNNTLFKLPEPPAHTTLAQWLAGNQTTDKTDSVHDGNGELNDKTTGQKNQNKSLQVESKCKKRRGSSDTLSVEVVDLLTNKQARLGWTLEEAKSVTIGELYLLFSCPPKIVLQYSWILDDNDGGQDSEANKTDTTSDQFQNNEVSSCEKIIDTNVDCKSEETITNPIDCEVKEKLIAKEKPLTILQKFLIAANLTLMNYKKQNVCTNTPHSTLANGSSSSGQNKSRKRTPKNNSQLLSNLIQETILADNNDTDQTESTNNQLEKQDSDKNKSCTVKNDNLSSKVKSNEQCNSKVSRSQSQSISSKSKYRTPPVLEDPTKIEEVLKKLEGVKNRRQRRPIPKSFMYNLPNKNIGSKLPNGTHSALLFIPASHLKSGEGSSSKQILLTDLITSHIPQASISITPNTNVSSTSVVNHKTNNQVVIPIQVEKKQMPLKLVESKPVVFTSLDTVGANIVGLSSKPEANVPAKSTNLSHEKVIPTAVTSLANCIPEHINNTVAACSSIFSGDSQCLTTSANKPEQESAQKPDFTTTTSVVSVVSSIGESNKTNQDVLTHSQLSWLNEANNDISIGSLIFETCANTNEDITMNQKSTAGPSLIDTHIGSFATDNSVDLMAKFADLAEEISSETKLN